MKNDLDQFEKNLLKMLNFGNATFYTHKNFAEWSSDRKVVEGNLRDGEKIYEVAGVFVTINPKGI